MTIEELLALNPFPGLRPFTRGEADLFFGRQQQIDELVDLLSQARLVAVAGTSGCGKSSLVLAGLTSELARRLDAGGEIEWRAVVARPGNHSIANLAHALAGALGMADDPARIDALYGRLSLGSLGLIDAIRAARLEPHVRVLVVIDQFEEIFRFRQADPEEPSAFVKLLLAAVDDPDTPIGVVLTLRSSELGHCADFPGLAEAASRGQYLVPRLSRDQRKEALVKPVEHAGFRIAPRLVQRVLNDVSDDFDDLPIMQHVMSRTWRRWAEVCGGSRPVDVEDYEAVGAAANALANHADEAYESLTGLGALVEKVFRALTERIAAGIENRRPLEFDRLCAVTGGNRESVARIVERFRRPDTAFLMPPVSVPLATNPIIDISHESLIRQWPRLRDWAKSEADSRTALLRVVEAARRYEADEGDLAQGRDLERMLGWRTSAQPTPAWAALYTGEDADTAWPRAERFLEASEEAARRARRRRSRRTWMVRGTVVFMLLFGWAFAVSVYGLQKQATSDALAGLALAEPNAAIAAHLALAAIEKNRDNPRAERSLRQALAELEHARTTRAVEFGAPIEDAGYGADRTHLAVAGGRSARVYRVPSLDLVRSFERTALVQRAWLAGANEWLLTLTESKQLEVEKLGGGGLASLSCPEGGRLAVVTVSADGHGVAAGCSNGAVVVWNAGAWSAPAVLPNAGGNESEVTALAFSPDRRRLAGGRRDGRLLVWERGDGDAWLARHDSMQNGSGPRHLKRIRDVAFDTASGAKLATGSDDRTAIVWNLGAPGRMTAEKALEHSRSVGTVRFVAQPEGGTALMTVVDKDVVIWRESERLTVRPNDDVVRDANVSADGRYIATANVDGNAALTSTLTGVPVAVLRGHRNYVMRALFMPAADTNGDGAVQLITASADGYLRVWRIRPPEVLAATRDFILSAAFDRDGRRAAYCGRADTQRTACAIVTLAPEGVRRTPLQADGVTEARGVSWSSDGKWVLARRSEGGSAPVLWDAHTGREQTPAWLKNYAHALFSQDAPRLLTVDADGRLAVWDNASLTTDNPSALVTHKGRPGMVRVAISPDARWVASYGGGSHRQLWLWDTLRKDAEPRLLDNGRGGAEPRSHDGRIGDAQFSPDSRRLVTASADQTARIWNVALPPGERDAAVELVGGHGSYVLSAAFSPDGRLVATGSADRGIGIWNADKGHLLALLPSNADETNQVRLQPGKVLGILSASDDGSVKLTRCAACTLEVAKLRERVTDDVPLTKTEQDARDEATRRVAQSVFRWPDFLAR